MPIVATRAAQRRDAATSRVRALAAVRALAGVVLTRPGPVAWASGGMNVPIDRGAPVDTVWVAIGPQSYTVVTTEVERDRIAAELLPAGADLVAVPWWDPAAMVAAAAEALGAAPEALGSDGHPAFGHDLDQALAAVRLPLSASEQDDLRELGADATRAVEGALRAWRPGQSDREVAARIASAVERSGADAPVLLVGADDRVRRFRHPVAVGEPARELVMAVLVARRAGLHVALTRYVAAGATPELDAGLRRVRSVHRAVLGAVAERRTYGEVLTELDAAYARAGFPRAWERHYQGGPIGFGQREFELAPVQADSPWWPERPQTGTAVAFNPSLDGGAKDEDTFVLTEHGVERVTVGDQWPGTPLDGTVDGPLAGSAAGTDAVPLALPDVLRLDDRSPAQEGTP